MRRMYKIMKAHLLIYSKQKSLQFLVKKQFIIAVVPLVVHNFNKFIPQKSTFHLFYDNFIETAFRDYVFFMVLPGNFSKYRNYCSINSVFGMNN